MGFALFQGFLIIFVLTALLIFWFLKGTFLFCRGTMLKIKGGNQKIAGMMIKGGWIRVIIPVIVVIIIWGCNSFSKFAEEKKEENFIVYAAKNGDYELVKELLESGVPADANDYNLFKGNFVSSRDYNTALCEAVYLNDYEMAELLLEYGADPDYRNLSSNTPFRQVMNYKHYDTMDLFFSYGADPNLYLEEACRRANVEAVRRLLEYGADPDIMVDENNTLLNYVDKEAEKIGGSNKENFKIISELLKENLRENK